ncbi:MAG: 2-isopropylmalate synthase, partial [Gammaproteobacteria bacterium]|nr:2-isopropylmalate synthase [Gammaproteobacteria bacterium]
SESHQGEVDGKTIHGLFMQRFVEIPGEYQLQGYHLDKKGGEQIQLELLQQEQTLRLKGHGKGAIEAFIDAWVSHYGDRINILNYSEHALATGSDAEAICYVQLEHNGQTICAAAIDQDTVSASLKAVLTAINRAVTGTSVAA